MQTVLTSGAPYGRTPRLYVGGLSIFLVRSYPLKCGPDLTLCLPFSFYLKTGLIAFSICESGLRFSSTRFDSLALFMAHWRWINQKETFWAQQKGMDDMATDRISKPLYKILSELTQESRVEVALPLAIKDLVRLKLKETREQQEAFTQRYGMDFPSFKRAWHEGLIEQKHSYEVERDYWEWEATVTDAERLLEMFESLP